MIRGAVLIALALACLTGIADARPPDADELPRLDQMLEEVKKELDAAVQAAAEASRDEDRDFVAQYQAEKCSATKDHRRMVDIIDTRSFDRDKKGLRELAAKVLAERWPQTRKDSLRVRKEISPSLVKLLYTRGHDEKSNRLAIQVLKSFWGTDKGYTLDASPRDKMKAIRRWTDDLKR